MKKIQEVDWSTEEAGAEGPLRICVGVFNLISTDKWSSTVFEMHNVEMNSLLNKPAHECSTIGKNLGISYKITGAHDATKTLEALLVFLSNLAGWQPSWSSCQPNQPKLVEFLEWVIQKLILTAKCDWQYKFKAHKHIGLAIPVKLQQIIANLPWQQNTQTSKYEISMKVTWCLKTIWTYRGLFILWNSS